MSRRVPAGRHYALRLLTVRMRIIPEPLGRPSLERVRQSGCVVSGRGMNVSSYVRACFSVQSYTIILDE